MPNDAEALADPLEDLLADWFAGALLSHARLLPVDGEAAYAAHLTALDDARAQGRALARAACLRLGARLERRFATRRGFSPAPPVRVSSCRPPPRPACSRSMSFELSI